MIETHLIAIGSLIKLHRTAKRLTQQQLAEASELRTATISDIEKGKLNFEITTLVKIAGALDCDLDIELTSIKKFKKK